MMRPIAIVLGTCGSLVFAGCTSGDSYTAEWIEQFRMFVGEFARNALAALLV